MSSQQALEFFQVKHITQERDVTRRFMKDIL